MIIKRKDYERLIRGYEIDKKKLDNLYATCREKTDTVGELVNKFDMEEKYSREDLSVTRALLEEAEDTLNDISAYEGGEMYSSIVEFYKSSGEKLRDIARVYSEAKKKVPLPSRPIVFGEEELLDFADCNTEEEIIKWTRDRLIESMSDTLPLPVESNITRHSGSYLRSTDKGMRAFFMGEERVKPEGETVLHLEKRGRHSMTRTITMNGDVVRDSMGALGYGVFHNEVYTGISNLALAGNRIVKASTIAREIRRNPKARIPQKEQRRIIDAIRDMMIFLKIDYTSEANLYHYGKDTQTVYEGALLDVEMITTESKVNGTVVDNAIKINSIPILFRLSLMKNQVVETPKTARLPEKMYRTDEVGDLYGYLEQRVIAGKPGKNGKQKSLTLRTIKVQTLLREVTGSTTWDRKTKVRILNSAIDIFAEWKRTGFIVDYTSNIGRERREREQRILFAVSEPQKREIRKAIEK